MEYLFKSKYWFVIMFVASFSQIGRSQQVIEIINPSFEGKAKLGETYFSLKGWQDCGFHANETPPDLHSASTEHFGVSKAPFEGKTFIGLVARELESNEAIGQKLIQALSSGFCYEMSVHLCRDLNYQSPVKSNLDVIKFFDKPIKLIIWGGNSFCGKNQKLGETEAISSSDWQEHIFRFNAEGDYKFITLEAYWMTPILIPYNGSILIDQMSAIVQMDCNSGAPKYDKLAAVHQNRPNDRKDPYQKTITNTSKNSVGSDKQKSSFENQEPIIKTISGVKVKDFLSSNKQLQIRDLIFPADTFTITPASYSTLDEIYYFLKQNKTISLEVGGHTNGLPSHEICDKLSSRRAKAVKNYIIDKGIASNRIIAKGYGKRKPLVSNKTSVGRERNQRVEIKIIER